MAGVPNNFLFTSEAAIASYDAMDAALSVGYATYYGLTGANSLKQLSSVALDSQTQYTVGSSSPAGVGNAAAMVDLDFDLEFKRPQIVEGNALINVTYSFGALQGSASSGEYGYLKCNVNIYHVSTGAVETSIGSLTNNTYKSNEWNVLTAHRECLIVAVSKKAFAIGEKLRVNIILFGYEDFSGTGKFTPYLYHDPSSRENTPEGDSNFTSHSTDLTVMIPYRIDL